MSNVRRSRQAKHPPAEPTSYPPEAQQGHAKLPEFDLLPLAVPSTRNDPLPLDEGQTALLNRLGLDRNFRKIRAIPRPRTWVKGVQQPQARQIGEKPHWEQ